MLQIQGSKIVEHGEDVQLRGLSLGNWLLLECHMLGLPWIDVGIRSAFDDSLPEIRGRSFWDHYRETYITEEDIAYIASLKFNLVRVPFTYRLFEDDEAPGVYKEEGFLCLERLFSWCEKYGIHVLLDLHAAPGGQADDWNSDNITGYKLLWYEADQQERMVALWNVLADRFKDEKMLFGYDLLCEPVAPDTAVLNELYRRTIRAIRSVDPDHIIQLEPNMWARDPLSLDDDLFDDAQVMTQEHIYLPLEFDPDVLGTFPTTHEGKVLDKEWIRSSLKELYRPDCSRPRMIGEFGIHFPDKQYDYCQAFIEVLEEEGYHWCQWAYKDVGQYGFVSPKQETAFMQFIFSEKFSERWSELNRLFGVTFGDYLEASGEICQKMMALYDSVDVDTVKREVRNARRHLERLHLLWMLEKLKQTGEEKLYEMATSFTLNQCVSDAEMTRIFREVLGK